MPRNTQFQLDLFNVLSQHCTGLKVHDEIISVIKRYNNEQSLTFSSHNLKTRSSLLKDLERNMDTSKLKPQDVDVNLTFGRQATIYVFGLETMIISLLTDPTLMQPKNIAHVNDLFTASVKGTTQMTVMEKSILEMHGNLLDRNFLAMTILSICQ